MCPAAEIYGGSREDILFRCALLSKAALEAPWVVPCGGAVYGEDNLVFVANDWHTSLLPFYLQVSSCVLPMLVVGLAGRAGCWLLSRESCCSLDACFTVANAQIR